MKYECENCGFTFEEESDYTRYYKEYTPDKIYTYEKNKCSDCDSPIHTWISWVKK